MLFSMLGDNAGNAIQPFLKSDSPSFSVVPRLASAFWYRINLSRKASGLGPCCIMAILVQPRLNRRDSSLEAICNLNLLGTRYLSSTHPLLLGLLQDFR